MSQQQETSRAPRGGESEPKFDSIGAALIHTREQPWTDMGGGNSAIVLRVSKETGFFSMLIKAPAGQVNAPHTHIGAADFYVISGGFDYRGGSARAGDWVYEPAGAVHDVKVTGSTPFKVLGIYVVDKTKPLATPAS